jgi:hypothetical protein
MRKSRSLNEGSSDCPSSGSTAAASATITPIIAYAGFGERIVRANNQV